MSNGEIPRVKAQLGTASAALEAGRLGLERVNDELLNTNQNLKEKIEELRRSNQDLQNFMASTDVGTIFLDNELRIKLYTPFVQRIFNIGPNDIGKPLEKVSTKAEYRDIERDVRDVAKTLVPVERAFLDGDNRWYLARVVPYRTTAERVEGTVITFIDITKRLETEKHLRWLATVVESSSDAMFSFAFDRKIVSWNSSAEAMFGYLADEAMGKELAMLTFPGCEDQDADLLERSWNGENIKDFETVQAHKGGTEIHVNLSLTPIRDEKDKIIGLSATVRDISKRVGSEEALRQTEERQRLLIESAKDFAMFTLTPAGIIDSWNSGAQRVFGFTEKEALGQPGAIVFTPEDRELGIPEMEMRIATQKNRAADERYHIRKDGSRFFASGIMAPLVAGKRQGFAKIARDLTEKRLAEEALQKAHEELEDKVIERTAELAESNESLRLEIEERLRAEEVRVGLLRKIVTTQEAERRRIARDIHDHLGQRLTGLRLKIASLREHCEDNVELLERVTRLEEIGVGLDSEVNFLAWELRPAALDDLGLAAAVGNYVSRWSEQFEIPAEFHEISMKDWRLGPETETNLYRIAQEALNNACKHAQAKRASVLLERRDGHVVLIIEDDGVGFDPEDKQRVSKAGQGLGLVGMRERATIVGGEIEIESEPGKGTTIFIRVPVEEQ